MQQSAIFSLLSAVDVARLLHSTRLHEKTWKNLVLFVCFGRFYETD